MIMTVELKNPPFVTMYPVWSGTPQLSNRILMLSLLFMPASCSLYQFIMGSLLVKIGSNLSVAPFSLRGSAAKAAETPTRLATNVIVINKNFFIWCSPLFRRVADQRRHCGRRWAASFI
jgi:hypothetical protein